MAKAYLAQGKLAEAESLARHPLVVWTSNLGPHNFRTLSAKQILASICRKMQRFEEAQILQLDALAGRQEIFGTFHPSSIKSKKGLSLLYNDIGRLDETYSLQIQVLEEQKAFLRPGHPETSQSELDLAKRQLLCLPELVINSPDTQTGDDISEERLLLVVKEARVVFGDNSWETLLLERETCCVLQRNRESFSGSRHS
jgi:hypothetical protein